MKNTEYSKLTKPMTVGEFVNMIFDEMKIKGLIPDIIEYTSNRYFSAESKRQITYYEFEIETITAYGSNEGIYTDFYIVGEFDKYSIEKKERILVGIAKTLNWSDEDVRIMARFGADFYLTATHYINNNINDFSWMGYNLTFKGEKGGLECWNEEAVLRNIKRWFNDKKDLSNLVITRLNDREIVPVETFLNLLEKGA